MPTADKIKEYVSALSDNKIDPPRGGLFGITDRWLQRKAAERKEDIPTQLEMAMGVLMEAQRTDLGYNVVGLVVPTEGAKSENIEKGSAAWMVRQTIEMAASVQKYGGWRKAQTALGFSSVAIELPLDNENFERTFGLDSGELTQLINGRGDVAGEVPRQVDRSWKSYSLGRAGNHNLPPVGEDDRLIVVQREAGGGNKDVVVGGVTEGLRGVVIFRRGMFLGSREYQVLETGSTTNEAGVFLVGE